MGQIDGTDTVRRRVGHNADAALHQKAAKKEERKGKVSERERERMLRSNHWSEEQMKFGVIK